VFRTLSRHVIIRFTRRMFHCLSTYVTTQVTTPYVGNGYEKANSLLMHLIHIRQTQQYLIDCMYLQPPQPAADIGWGQLILQTMSCWVQELNLVNMVSATLVQLPGTAFRLIYMSSLTHSKITAQAQECVFLTVLISDICAVLVDVSYSSTLQILYCICT